MSIDMYVDFLSHSYIKKLKFTWVLRIYKQMCKKPFSEHLITWKDSSLTAAKWTEKLLKFITRMVDNTLIDFSVRVSRSVEVSFVSFGSQIYEVACYRPYHCSEESCVKFPPLQIHIQSDKCSGRFVQSVAVPMRTNRSCKFSGRYQFIYDEIMLLR